MGTVAGAKKMMCTVVAAIPWHFFYESMLEKGDKQSSYGTTIYDQVAGGRRPGVCLHFADTIDNAHTRDVCACVNKHV